MSEIELNPIEFITVGTVGPKGKRQFNLQGGTPEGRIVTLVMEKEQARRLAEAVNELLDELKKRKPDAPEQTVNLNQLDMDLRDPIEPEFRISQMGLGYDEEFDRIILVVEELVIPVEETEFSEAEPSIVRFWGTREQYRALAIHTLKVVDQGRPDPNQNGYTIYYWV
jgi:uncharacterized repeat protein (TIGR03847 family)